MMCASGEASNANLIALVCKTVTLAPAFVYSQQLEWKGVFFSL
jgi:hypothetical protein